MLTKAELEFYESARRSLASISKTLETLTDDVIKTAILNRLRDKLARVQKMMLKFDEKSPYYLGKCDVLEELIKEIEDGKI